MQTRKLDRGFRLEYHERDVEDADTLAQAVEPSLEAIKETWGLEPPKRCRIQLMTSWLWFLFSSTSWRWWPFYALTLPLWAWRVSKRWPSIGGWCQRSTSRYTVGVKPTRLLEKADRRIGKLIFNHEPDAQLKMTSLFCHELTHVCSADLKLPAWLNEGIAMVAADRLAGKQTVKEETLDWLREPDATLCFRDYRDLRQDPPEDAAYQYARAYWIARFLIETRPGFLADVARDVENAGEVEERIEDMLEIERGTFWCAIDRMAHSHFDKGAPSVEDAREEAAEYQLIPDSRQLVVRRVLSVLMVYTSFATLLILYVGGIANEPEPSVFLSGGAMGLISLLSSGLLFLRSVSAWAVMRSADERRPSIQVSQNWFAYRDKSGVRLDIPFAGIESIEWTASMLSPGTVVVDLKSGRCPGTIALGAGIRRRKQDGTSLIFRRELFGSAEQAKAFVAFLCSTQAAGVFRQDSFRFSPVAWIDEAMFLLAWGLIVMTTPTLLFGG